MSKIGSYKLAIQVIFKVLSAVAGLVLTRILTSNFSVSENADYSLALAYVAIVNSILDLGIPLMVQKYYTNEEDVNILSRIWTTLMSLRFISYLVGLVIIFFSYRLSGIENLGLIILAFTTMFILVVDLSFKSLCDAKNRTWQFSITDFLGKLIIIAVLSFYLAFVEEKTVSTLQAFLVISLISYATVAIIDHLLQAKYIKYGQFDFKFLKDNKLNFLFLSLSSLFVATYLSSDKLLLGYFNNTDQAIAEYSTAYKIFENVLIVPAILMPTIASMVKNNLDSAKLSKLSKFLQTNLKVIKNLKTIILIEALLLIFGLALLTYLGVLFGGEFIVNFIDAENLYPQSLELLQVLALSVIPVYFVYFLGYLTIFLHGEKYELVTTFLAMVVTLALYSQFIPLLGNWGAAISTSLSYASVLVVRTVLFVIKYKKYLGEQDTLTAG